MSGLPLGGYQSAGPTGQALNVMGQPAQGSAMQSMGGLGGMASPAAGAQRMNPSFLTALQGAGYGQASNGFPGPVPAQNPPTGGVAGAPGYSVAHPAQLNGNYWNQVAQQLAGPTYQYGTSAAAQAGAPGGGASYPTGPRGGFLTNTGQQGSRFLNR